LLEQELAHLLPASWAVATQLIRVEVDRNDPAFDRCTKFIGSVCSQDKVQRVTVAIRAQQHSRMCEGAYTTGAEYVNLQ
jgi:carbamate kinase